MARQWGKKRVTVDDSQSYIAKFDEKSEYQTLRD